MPTNQTQFLKDIQDHTMTVLQDDGVRRHLRFGRVGESCESFEILTWPGTLCYTGDMGTFVFSRTTDMFKFFRTDQSNPRLAPGDLAINPGYWAEKIQATDMFKGHSAFDPDKFRQNVLSRLDSAFEHLIDDETNELPPEHQTKKTEVLENLKSEVFYISDSGGEQLARSALDGCSDSKYFGEFWDVDCCSYTNRFIWCCYALAWSIATYDKSKAATFVA